MDHLPAVPNATVPGLETAPYVCQNPYDGGPFLTYPARENRPEIIPDAPKAGKKFLWEYEKRHPTPNKEFEAFCQTWLFFGLINELLGDICTPADFLRLGEDDDSNTISTTRLPALVEQWVTSVQDGSSSMTYEHVAQCLRLTHTTLMATGPHFDLSVKFCIASVGEYFEYAANRAFKIGNLVLENACPAAWHSLFEHSIQAERLGRSGWCPSQIEIMVHPLSSLQSFYFFASMHDSVSAGRHGLCDNIKCVAYQTDLKNYATQHATKECGCEEFCVDMSSLDAVLKTGALPLLRIHEAETLDQLTVEVVASQPEFSYLALSHVWADGLGNTERNALPRCQLLQLRRLTQSLSAKLGTNDPEIELLFWCDTLCCPASPGKGKDSVLAQMKNIYEQATCVLVLDASIRLHRSEAMRPDEACARIVASGWMRRLWTFQEGVLPAHNGRLWFQFREEAINLRPLWQEIVRIFNSEWDRKGLATDIINWLAGLRTFFRREIGGADLAKVDAAFQHRSVSVSSDEPLLIGTLLDLDVASILSSPHETRMRRMWSLMPAALRGIPKSILFRLGPRLKEEGYRWAPSSMLYRENTNVNLGAMRKGDDQGIPTEHGLLVRLSGYHISFPERPRGLPVNPWSLGVTKDLLYMREGEACWYIARRRWPNAEGDYLSKEQFSSTSLRSPTNLWITLLEIDFHPRVGSFQQISTALLTKLINESCEIKYVNSYMHIHVFRLRKHVCEILEAAYRCAQKLAMSAPAGRLANMSEDEINMESPEYKAVFDTLELEIYRSTVSGEYSLALAAAREHSGLDDDALFGVFVRLIFIGEYAVMDSRTPDSQQWCVD